MIEASCHCGALKLEIARKPRDVTECNCSICRRYGVLWAYYRASDVKIKGGRTSKSSYVWGPKTTRFVRCRRCGCVTHWEETRKSARSRIGINARNFHPRMLEGLRIRHLDGAQSWRYLD